MATERSLPFAARCPVATVASVTLLFPAVHAGPAAGGWRLAGAGAGAGDLLLRSCRASLCRMPGPGVPRRAARIAPPSLC